MEIAQRVGAKPPTHLLLDQIRAVHTRVSWHVWRLQDARRADLHELGIRRIQEPSACRRGVVCHERIMIQPSVLAALAPADIDASMVSDEIARIVALPEGECPYRVHIDPADDGSAEVSMVADRIRSEFLTRIGLADLLHPVPRK